jgi:hypothetical protein
MRGRSQGPGLSLRLALHGLLRTGLPNRGLFGKPTASLGHRALLTRVRPVRVGVRTRVKARWRHNAVGPLHVTDSTPGREKGGC